jgi:hypothetical protein
VGQPTWKHFVDVRMIAKLTIRNWGGDMDWIYLAQNGARWRMLVSAVMKLRVP